jgi:predicted acyl esterase
MDDGVVLYADIAYPTVLQTGERAPGPFPVALEHTPYTSPLNTYFAQYGYVSVKVFARGSGKSGGSIQFYTDRDGEDGKAIIDWAAQLDGVDGTVGQFGCSYPGGLSLADAAAVGPDSPLKATVAMCTGLDVAREGFLAGGIITQSVEGIASLGMMMGDNAPTRQYFQDRMDEARRGGDAAYDNEFWSARLRLAWTEDIVNNGIPVLLWSGWDDCYAASALHTYSALQNAAQGRSICGPMRPDEPATPRYQIIHGDWEHGGGLDDGIVLAWFETWLKGVGTGLDTTSTPMHLFERGTNRYVNAAHYPAVSTYRPAGGQHEGDPALGAPDRRRHAVALHESAFGGGHHAIRPDERHSLRQFK